MAKNYSTPGVYIEEINAFPGSVVEVATAIPAFIGHTKKASLKGKSLEMKPVRITSLKEYVEMFGEGNDPLFDLTEGVTPTTLHQIKIGDKDFTIDYQQDNKLYFYDCIRHFYANGGSTCYIVSVGTFGKEKTVTLEKDPIIAGLNTLVKEQEPTMIVVPDAVNLDLNSCYDVYTEVLAHCAKMQSRVAILDIYDGYKNRTANEDVVKTFRGKIGTENLKYAAAYYPWLHTNTVQKTDISWRNLDAKSLYKLLPEAAAQDVITKFPKKTEEFASALIKEKHQLFAEAFEKDQLSAKSVPAAGTAPKKPNPLKPNASDEEKKEHQKKMAEFKLKSKKHEEADKMHNVAQKVLALKMARKEDEEMTTQEATANNNTLKNLGNALADDDQKSAMAEVSALLKAYIKNKGDNFHLGLLATSLTYANLLEKLAEVRNLLPPAAAMAGIYTSVDDSRGVWKAPANVSVNSVIKPWVNITHDEQKDLNVDAQSGKSVNAIRTFPGIGTLIWGGRTLDGNSLDWRYINVRRTMIMLEQSIKLALRAYVFEPNDANTWVTVKSMIVNFLTDKWKQGALAGASPEDAFDVQIGLGSTMTSVDILEGRMLVSVKLAIVRPAEFIVVTFEQQMQKS